MTRPDAVHSTAASHRRCRARTGVPAAATTASPGVDRVTVDEYEQALESNLQHLHARVHSGQYWPKPVRRTYIPKSDGGRRPLGIPALEDKIVQGAVAEVLNAVYEGTSWGSATASGRGAAWLPG